MATETGGCDHPRSPRGRGDPWAGHDRRRTLPALAYAGRAGRCSPASRARKTRLPHGYQDATTDEQRSPAGSPGPGPQRGDRHRRARAGRGRRRPARPGRQRLRRLQPGSTPPGWSRSRRRRPHAQRRPARLLHRIGQRNGHLPASTWISRAGRLRPRPAIPGGTATRPSGQDAQPGEGGSTGPQPPGCCSRASAPPRHALRASNRTPT